MPSRKLWQTLEGCVSRQLVWIEPLGRVSELSALELADDMAELVDLAVALLFIGDQVTDEPMQEGCTDDPLQAAWSGSTAAV